MSDIISFEKHHTAKVHSNVKRNVKQIQADAYAYMLNALEELSVDLKSDIFAYEDYKKACHAFTDCAINHHKRMQKIEK